MDSQEKEYWKQKIEYGCLLGNFIGTLEGILWWEIPTGLRLKLEQKIKELKQEKI